MTRWGPFSWTTGEAVWGVIIAAGAVVEILGLCRVQIPFTDSTFVPLTLPVERNIERRPWVGVLVWVFLTWLIGHWYDVWPWESKLPTEGE